MPRNTLLSQEPATSIEDHFELLLAEEGVRPVTTPTANPPTAPARIPIRIKNFAFSRMEVLCLTEDLQIYTSSQILSQFVQERAYKLMKPQALCVVNLHIVMQHVSLPAKFRVEISCKLMILQT